MWVVAVSSPWADGHSVRGICGEVKRGEGFRLVGGAGEGQADEACLQFSAHANAFSNRQSILSLVFTHGEQSRAEFLLF